MAKPQKRQAIDFPVLFAAIIAPSMVFMSSTALNVALPAIQHDLGARGADLLWILNAYAITQVAFIFLGGSLGDHYGRKRIYLAGILLFGLGSLICGFTASRAVFIAARVIQGIGSGIIIPCSLAIITVYFDEDKQGWAIGIWSAFTMLIAGAGPVIGGWLTEIGFWRSIFFINIPLGIATMLALIVYVPESYDEEAPKEMDVPGTILSTVGLMLAAFAWTEGVQRGFEDPLVLIALMVGLAAFPLFLWVERRSDHAMMPLHLFKSRTFSGANIVTYLLYAAINTALVFLPLNLIQIQGYSETFAGFSLLPITLLMGGISFFISHAVDLYGPRPPLIVGPLLIGVALAWLGMLGITGGQASYWTTFLPPICLFGVGMGMTLAPLTTAVMGSVPQHHAGIASSIHNTLSRSSQVLGIAMMGGLAIALFNQSLMSSPTVAALPAAARDQLAAESVNLAETAIPAALTDEARAAVSRVIRESFAEAISVVMWLAAGLCLASALAAALLIKKEPHASEEIEPQRHEGREGKG